MIEDMALLKRTMQQMDAEDPTVAQAAKDRAAQMLGEAKLNFVKMAELIQERRLLLRPAIVANIKRMDQPGPLGDAAFHDTGTALRKEGQSFLQIAEAIEATARPAPAPAVGSSAPSQESEPLYSVDDELRLPGWLGALAVVASLIFFPLRHPLRFAVIALLALVLFYGARGLVAARQQLAGYFGRPTTVDHQADATTSASSSGHEQASETTAPPTPPAPVPSPTMAPPPSTIPPAASFDAAPPPAASSAAPAPSVSAPSRSAASRTRTLEDAMPVDLRRNSRIAGPCRGGVGGCYWGGVRF